MLAIKDKTHYKNMKKSAKQQMSNVKCQMSNVNLYSALSSKPLMRWKHLQKTNRTKQ